VRIHEKAGLVPQLHDWQTVRRRCANAATLFFDRINGVVDAADEVHRGGEGSGSG